MHNWRYMFTSLEMIRENLFCRHPNKELQSVIIKLVTNVNDGKNDFYGIKLNT